MFSKKLKKLRFQTTCLSFMFIPLPSVSQLFAALVAAWITMLTIEWLKKKEKGLEKNEQQNAFLVCFEHKDQLAVCQNLVPLVNIKIAGKWMFIPLKMVLIGIDQFPNNNNYRSPLWYGPGLPNVHGQ